MRSVYAIACLMIVAAPAYSQEADRNSTFGITFGDTLEKLRAKGTVFTVATDIKSNAAEWYHVQKFPNHPQETDLAAIAVTDKGLQKIIWMSKTITDDALGSEGKRKFSYYEEILTKKYGPVESSFTVKRAGMTLYKDADEFYQCLKYDGCGYWMTGWKGDWGTAILTIEGTSNRGSGWLKIAYEGPYWSAALQAEKAKQQQKDQGAF